jgi:hypothetical protein
VSRADPEPGPATPTLRGAIRDAAADFYYNGWAFLGANVAVGLVLLAAVYGSIYVGAWIILLAAGAVVPAAGTMRMATRLHRDGHTDLGDFAEIRRHRRVLLLALAELAIVVVLAVDVAVGSAWASWLGVVLVVGAIYGAVAIWALSVVAWPILLDPARDTWSIRDRLRLGAVVLFVNVRRIAGLALIAGLLLAISAVLVAPLLTVAVSFTWLFVARMALPLSDDAEERLATRR